MEPERKIEKLLRAYAKKRRADAGDSLTLHPATRRLLQDEVARRKPRPDADEEASVTLWELVRQRWALLAGFAVVVFLGAALIFPGLHAAKLMANKRTADTKYHLMQIGTAARMYAEDNHGRLPGSFDDMTNELQPDLVNVIATDPESGKPFIYVAGGEKLDGLSSNAVLAYSSTDKKGHAVLFADGRVEVVPGARLAELTNRGLLQLVAESDSANRQQAEVPVTLKDAEGNTAAAFPVAGQPKSEAERSDVKLADSGGATTTAGTLAVNAPAAAPPAVDRLAKAPGAAGSDFKTASGAVQFATATQNFNFGVQNSFKNTIAPAKAAVVLANFQVQQSGNAIRVVDADGSVYDGALQPENVQPENEVAQKEQFSAGTGSPAPASTPAEVDRQKAVAARDEPQMTQNYFFRVAGTNLTLKQNVVFNGNLLAKFSAVANGQQAIKHNGNFGGGGVGGQLQSALTNQLPWSNSLITGTAVVSDTNSIEVNAVPQSP